MNVHCTCSGGYVADRLMRFRTKNDDENGKFTFGLEKSGNLWVARRLMDIDAVGGQHSIENLMFLNYDGVWSRLCQMSEIFAHLMKQTRQTSCTLILWNAHA